MSTTGLWLSRRSIRRSAGLSSIELHNKCQKRVPVHFCLDSGCSAPHTCPRGPSGASRGEQCRRLMDHEVLLVNRNLNRGRAEVDDAEICGRDVSGEEQKGLCEYWEQ